MRNYLLHALLLIALIISGTSLRGQVGRVEVTMDTVPVGGEEQREKMAAMEAHDRLFKELVLLRDSVDIFMKARTRQDASYKSAVASQDQLSQMIRLFKNSEHSPELYQRGSELLKDKRTELSAWKRK
jgi:hypothetical protein